MVSSYTTTTKSRHVTRLYERVRGRGGHQTAIGAVARHLAQSTYWMLKKKEEYCEPKKRRDFVHEKDIIMPR